MAAVTTQQYRPVSNCETDAGDGLSIASLHEMAAAINNLKYNVIRHKARSQVWFPHRAGPDSGTITETLVVLFAPIWLPDGYNYIEWWLGHYLVGGTSTRWTLYLASNLYNGPDGPFDTTYLAQPYNTAQMSSTSTSHVVTKGTNIAIVRDKAELTWPLMTALNSTSSSGKISTLDLYPKI